MLIVLVIVIVLLTETGLLMVSWLWLLPVSLP